MNDPERDVAGAANTDFQTQREAFLRQLFAQLEAGNIHYVVPRNFELLPQSCGKDLDLLVAPADLARFRSLTLALIRAFNWIGFSRYKDPRGVSIIASAPSSRGENVIPIDARAYISIEISKFHRVTAGVSRKIFATDIERRLTTLNGCNVYIPTVLDEWILLFKQANLKSKPKYYDRLRNLLAENRDLREWVERATKASTDTLLADLAIEKWTRHANHIVRARWSTPPVFATIWSCVKAINTWRIARGPLLMPIAYFSGPDGAGKTTSVAIVQNWLTDSHIEYRTYYSQKKVLRYLTRRLVWLKRTGKVNFDKDRHIEFKKIKPRAEDERDRNDGTPYWKFRKYIALLFGVIDIHIGSLLTLIDRARGRMVLIETSPYDIFMKYHMPEYPRTEKWLAPILPRPTIGLLLTATSEEIRKRKPELTKDEIIAYYNRIARVLEHAKITERYVAIDTGKSPEETRLPLLNEIARALG